MILSDGLRVEEEKIEFTELIMALSKVSRLLLTYSYVLLSANR